MKCINCKETHKNGNSGCYNSGNYNSGNRNSGDMNSGYRNSGNYNSGDMNSGYRNSGNMNSGNYNSGDMNSGYRNSGNYNSGNYNSGNMNSGYRNSGNYNSGDMNSGHFNTNSPDKIRIFNTWVEMSEEDFQSKYNIQADLPLNRWVNETDMTDDEKSAVKGWSQMGGYLKTLDFKEACKVWWEENEDRHSDFTGLPNFDTKIFEEITGIDVTIKEEIIEIDGKKFSTSTIKEALKQYVE